MWKPGFIAVWLALSSPAAGAGEPLLRYFSQPGPLCACATEMPPANVDPVVESRVLSNLALRPTRRVHLESTLSRSGVWDGALVIDRGHEWEARLWWENLTSKDYESVLFREGSGGAYAHLDSQPSAYGLTVRLRF